MDLKSRITSKRRMTKDGRIFLEWLFFGLEYKPQKMDKSLNPEKPVSFFEGGEEEIKQTKSRKEGKTVRKGGGERERERKRE